MSRNDASTVRRPPARRDLPWPLLAAGIAAWAASRLMRRSRAISFEGRVAVISGGSRGLGLLIARLLAADGARLALLARDPEELRRAADDIEQRGHERPFVQPCDIRERLQAEQAIREVAAHFGRIDVLVNDAGMIEVGPLEHMTVNDFETSMGVHFWGPLYLTLAALPHLKKHRGARLVNISSIGGRVAVPHLVPYSAGKFALTGLSDGLRAELAKDGIRVTTVLPWLMRTGSPFNAWFKGQHRAEFAWFTIFDSLPGLTVDGERAARRIVDACRHGGLRETSHRRRRDVPVVHGTIDGVDEPPAAGGGAGLRRRGEVGVAEPLAMGSLRAHQAHREGHSRKQRGAALIRRGQE